MVYLYIFLNLYQGTNLSY